MKKNRSIIMMTMGLSLLMFPLYITSYYQQRIVLLGLVYIVDRVITAYTGNTFSYALNEIDHKVDSGIDEKETAKFGNLLFIMVAWLIIVTTLYGFILFTNLPLFIFMISGELVDKVIEMVMKRVSKKSI